MRGRRLVDIGERAEIDDRRALPPGLQIGAEIGDVPHPQAEEVALPVEREFAVCHDVAALPVAQKGFGARADPFDRAPGHLGSPQHQGDLVVDRGFHAETAADVAGHHAHPAFRHAQHARQLAAKRMGALQRGVNGVVILRAVVDADAAARLHGGGGDAIDRETMAHHVSGLGEGRVGRRLVADLMHEADVVRAVVPYQRRAGFDCVGSENHGGLRLVCHLDELGRVDSLVESLGNHEGDTIAEVAHTIRDQRRIGRTEQRRSVASFLIALRNRQIAVTGTLPVFAGQNRKHARRRPGARRINR